MDDILLIPGNEGRDCPGNGCHTDHDGHPIECQCDECECMLDCLSEAFLGDYSYCRDAFD